MVGADYLNYVKQQEQLAHQSFLRAPSPELLKTYRQAATLKRLTLLQYENAHRAWWLPAGSEVTVHAALNSAVDQGLTFAALDTEHSSGPTVSNVATEIGFSRFNGRDVITEHYIVGPRKAKPKKFIHGKSRYFSRGPLLVQEFEYLFSTVDVILLWNMSNDLQALHKAGIVTPKHKVLDLQHWRHTPVHARKSSGGITYSLRDYCAIQGYKIRSPHNAGNDSHALLTATLLALGLFGEPIQIEQV